MKIKISKIQKYTLDLVEPSKLKSRGGNTRAWHRHAVTIDGETYSFLALGVRKWVYKADTIEFDWNWSSENDPKYRQIDKDSVKVWDKSGQLVVRGHRGTKPWRKFKGHESDRRKAYSVASNTFRRKWW